MEITVQRGAVPVELDRERLLFFDHKATWLLIKRYGDGFLTALYQLDGKGEKKTVVLKDMDALVFFLWAGLQAEAEATGVPLPLEEAAAFVTPFTYARIFNRLVTALGRGISTPAPAGKAEASGAAAEPAAGHIAAAAKGPGPTRVSTSLRRSASRTRS